MSLCQTAIVVSEAQACAIGYAWARRNRADTNKVERYARTWFDGTPASNQRTWFALIEHLRTTLPHAANPDI